MYAVVDIETTGGYAEYHRITEIAIVLHDGIKICDQYHTLVNPGRKIPHFITGLTGITHEMVADAPPFEDVAKDIYNLLEGRVFVAHNAYFDYSFLKREFELCGIRWQAKKLCTVRLSRKIVPGLRSYSLGSIASSMGIVIHDRHRAGGDAAATAKLFDRLLKSDKDNYISKALKRNSGETILPPNLPKEEFDRLPAKPGVYYFVNSRGTVVYIGKANNIKRRIAGHFTGEARGWSRTGIRNEIHHIRYELTGNEFLALILESIEIRRLWPRYNQAQKFRIEEWGIYSYTDRNRYTRFFVNICRRGVNPLLRFSSKGDAWNFLWSKVREFNLCPKLSGLQLSKDSCYAHQTGDCRGACHAVEDPESYNERAAEAIRSLSPARVNAVIVGRGRKQGERSVVVVDRGVFHGYGFLLKEDISESFDSIKQIIPKSQDTPTVQNLINSFLLNPREGKVIMFETDQNLVLPITPG